MSDPLKSLTKDLREFAAERDWDKYHTPKNLAMALSVEAAELVEIFQWLSEEESRALPPEKREHLAEEISDVLLYLLRLSDRFGIDVVAAARSKMKKNALKYPAGGSPRGAAQKG